MEIAAQQLVNGLTVGAFYALVALGYTMVYGIIRLINFAQGDLYTVGAFLGLSILSVFGGLLTRNAALATALGLLGAMALTAVLTKIKGLGPDATYFHRLLRRGRADREAVQGRGRAGAVRRRGRQQRRRVH